MTHRVVEGGDIATVYTYDELTDVLTEERIQDVEPILKANEIMRNEGKGFSPSREWRRIASIPNIFVEKWLKEEGIDVYNKEHWPAVERKLRDPDYSKFRTSSGGL